MELVQTYGHGKIVRLCSLSLVMSQYWQDHLIPLESHFPAVRRISPRRSLPKVFAAVAVVVGFVGARRRRRRPRTGKIKRDIQYFIGDYGITLRSYTL